MSRFQGFHRKVSRRIELLEHSLGIGTVAEGMRQLALTGEWPSNPRLKAEVEMMRTMAAAMAATVPRYNPEPKEEAVLDIPLSATWLD